MNHSYTSRQTLEKEQLGKLNKIILEIVKTKSSTIYADWPLATLRSLEELKSFPFLDKDILLDNQKLSLPFGSIHRLPLKSYFKMHQTSGTTNDPLIWLDTKKDWDWWKKCWSYVYQAAGFMPGDTVFFPFSFNFFIGLWSAFDAAAGSRLRVIPGGGQSSITRLNTIWRYAPKGLVTTPSYCFRLMEVAREENINLRSLSIRKIIFAGEPGGSLEGLRKQVNNAWDCEIFDHYGCTELGAMGYQCGEFKIGFHLNEDEFIFEVIDPVTLEPITGEIEGELVVTNLGRFGSPLIRYRTGDIVRVSGERCSCGRTHLRCLGGILGRRDDLVILKGVNIYPSVIESIIRNYPDIYEFRCFINRDPHNPAIRIRIEVENKIEENCTVLKKDIQNALQITPKIEVVRFNALPRTDGKSGRFVIV